MTPPPELDLAAARRLLDAQPFSRLLGARLTDFGDGGATLEIDIREDLHQQNGFLHGGVLAYAADNALTFAAGAVLGPAVLTGGFSVQYLRPATGRALRARARRPRGPAPGRDPLRPAHRGAGRHGDPVRGGPGNGPAGRRQDIVNGFPPGHLGPVPPRHPEPVPVRAP